MWENVSLLRRIALFRMLICGNIRRCIGCMRLEQLDYELPSNLIATKPAVPRDQARLMVVHSSSGRIEHHRISDLPDHLDATDIMVRNRSRVLPARIEGSRVDTGGRVSGLYLHSLDDGSWVAMLKSNGKLRSGLSIQLGEDGPVLELLGRDGASWIMRCDRDQTAEAVLQSHGKTPLPPYILSARGEEMIDESEDRDWYQTIYARESGSVAAPTAGLHFTCELEEALRIKGVSFLDVLLHVGPGTFQPVSAPTLDQHQMHREDYHVEKAVLDIIMATDRARRLVAVGTTTARVLESLPESNPGRDWSASTELMISPPWTWRHVDVLMTNFHLPRSTLLALVAARIGIELMHEAYAIAVEKEYRFYSYGDAMLLL